MAEKARALGFDLCRIAAPDAIPRAPERLRAFIEAGCAGDMDWLAASEPRRADPRVLWPDVRAIVMLGMNYGPAGDPLALLADRGAANISVYARHRDYHDVIKGKLKELAGWLVSASGGDVKVFVDTAPVMEKPLAAGGGARLAGQAHQSCLARPRLLAVPRLGLHHAGAGARPARGGPLRLLPRLPRHLPDGGLPGAVPARRAALHLVPDDRA